MFADTFPRPFEIFAVLIRVLKLLLSKSLEAEIYRTLCLQITYRLKFEFRFMVRTRN